MFYSKIYKSDITDGTGVRISLYVSGCRNKCPGCHNKESWNFTYGKPFTNDTKELLIDLLDHDYIDGLTVCGGEPMEPENQVELLSLLKEIKFRFPDKNIWCYTGYEFEDLLLTGKRHYGVTDELLEQIDVLVAGPFDISKRDVSDNNRWRGSTNQRVIDVPKSLQFRSIVYIDNIPNNN